MVTHAAEDVVRGHHNQDSANMKSLGVGRTASPRERRLLHFSRHQNFVCFRFGLGTSCFSGDASGPAVVLLYRAGMGEGHGEVPRLLTSDVQK